MTYHGKVTRRTPGRPRARRAHHHQDVGRRLRQQHLPPALPAHRRAAADRRRGRAPRLLQLVGDGGLARIVTTHQHGDHWGALARRGHGYGCADVAGADDADGIPVPTAVAVRDGDPSGSASAPRGHPPRRPHPGLHRAAVRRPRRHPAPVHRRLPVPRRLADNTFGDELPTRCCTTSRRSCSTGCPTRPGSTRSRRRLDARRRARLDPGVARPSVVKDPLCGLHARTRCAVYG